MSTDPNTLDDGANPTAANRPALADLLEQRRALDRAMQAHHAADMAILFTDIVGSTAFFEARGDVEGLALVHRHNELLFPKVARHHGRVVKTIGDAIMAVFPTADDAADAAVAMMQTLADDADDGHEAIHIRIGVHFGPVLKDKDDVFGDAVNVAARVNGAADADEILTTASFLEATTAPRNSRPRPDMAAKGKAAPIPVRALLWRDDDVVDVKSADAAERLFVLSIERGPKGLRLSAMDGESGKGTLNRHLDVDVSPENLVALGEQLRTFCDDGGQEAYRAGARQKGRALRELILPSPLLERVRDTPQRALRLHLDDAVARIPFELMVLDDDSAETDTPTIGERFAVGRILSAPDVEAALPAPVQTGTKVVIVADPAGDLPAAREEGDVLARLYRGVGVEVLLLSGPNNTAAVVDAVKDCRVLHLAAHIDRKHFGVVCTDGVVDGPTLTTAFGERTPSLVVANACHASADREWAAATFTRHLLDRGVPHVVAPQWSVPDDDARTFAMRLTEGVLSGLPLGECVRRARVQLHERSSRPLSHAAYVLYGDPRTRQVLGTTLKGSGRTRSGEFVAAPAVVATPTTEAARRPTPSSAEAPKTALAIPQPTASRLPLIAAAVAVLVLGGLVVSRFVEAPQDTKPPTESSAIAGPLITGTTGTTGTTTPAATPKPPATGPIRLSVLPFKGTAPPSAPGLGAGMAEALVTELAGAAELRLIERGQIDVDIGELDFQQSKYVDPATRTALGKIAGAEVVVLGAIASAGEKVRATARFVDVESGEILLAIKVDGSGDDVFALQDDLTAQVKAALPALRSRVRP